jgi:hypothetical protein
MQLLLSGRLDMNFENSSRERSKRQQGSTAHASAIYTRVSVSVSGESVQQETYASHDVFEHVFELIGLRKNRADVQH